MQIRRVELTNLRNYRHLEVLLPGGTTVIWGPNAAGKSGFLEAIHMLATTRSYRAGAERELIHWDAPEELGMPPFARIVGQVQRREGPLTLELSIQRKVDAEGQLTGRCEKRMLVNRRPVSTREAAGRLQVVLFEPDDLNLITGSPARRRRYLDTALMQADPRYWQALLRYQRVISQRNQLLRRWRDQGVPSQAREEMAFWNREMVQKGAILTVARQRFVDNLAASLVQLHGRLAGVSEPLRMVYQHHVPCSPREDEESVAYAYRRALEKRWRGELERGMTLLGPHRDDVGFFLGEIDLAIYGSRGQQRTATIALKLAQVEWLHQQSGETPVVLLDDVLSELDPERRGYLQGWFLGGEVQVVVTSTDLQPFQPMVLEQATIYRVEAGRWTGREEGGGADRVAFEE